MNNTDLNNLSDEQLFAQGATSCIYLVNLDGRQVVAKKAKNPERSNLGKEYSILSALDGSFTPEVYGLVKEPDRVILTERFIKGTHPAYGDKDFTIKFAKALSEFHKKCINIKIADVPEYTVSMFLDRNINEPFKRFSSCFSDDIKESITSLIERISKTVNENPQIFEGNVRTLVHTDLIPLNIICEESGGIVVIDWENARLDCGECDIATFLRGFRADESIRKAFLDNYTNEIDPVRLRICGALHYLQVAIWWTDSQSGFKPTDEILGYIYEDIRGAERSL